MGIGRLWKALGLWKKEGEEEEETQD